MGIFKRIKVRGILFTIVLLAIYCSCDNNTGQPMITSSQIVIDSLTIDTISFDNQFCDIKLIPLENRYEAMLSYVPSMVITDKWFIMLDERDNENVLLFDHDGKYHGNVGEVGHGHGEFNAVFDVTTDTADNIYLLDFDKILKYDLNGKYIQTLKSPLTHRLKNILCYNNGIIGASNYSGNKMLLHAFNNSLELQSEFLSSEGVTLGNPTYIQKSLQIKSDTLCYFNPYKSVFTLFNLNDLQPITQYILISNKMRSIDITKEEEKSDVEIVDEITSYYLDNGKIVGDLIFNDKSYSLEIDIQNRKSTLKVKDGWFPQIYDIQDEWFYTFFEQDCLLDILHGKYRMSKESKSMLERAYEKMGREITEKDNFIIMKMKKKQ